MEVKQGSKAKQARAIGGWRDCDISDLCQLQRGFDLTEATRERGAVPVYSSSGISYFHSEAKLQPPSVITGRKGLLGRVFFVEEPCWPHDTTLWVKDFKGNDPQFVALFLRAFRLERFDAATSVPTLNRNNLVGHPIKIPALPEQCAIASTLSDVDALLSGLDRFIAKKRDLKQAAMQQLLTGQTRLPGFSEEWRPVEFGDIATIRNAKVVSSSTPAGMQCVELESIGQGSGRLLGSIEATGPSSKYSFKKNDVLFGRLRAYLRKYWLAQFDGICSTEIWPLIPRDQRLCAGYLHLLVQTHGFIDAAGVSYGTHMPRSDWTVLGKCSVLLPPLPEQTAIAATLSDMDAELAALEARRDKTRLLKLGMMEELLTGKTRLITPEPAHA